MQNLPIYLYSNTVTVILDSDASIQGVTQTMYQRDLVVQKGIKNQIRVQFKNSDQKRLTLDAAQTFVFSLFDGATQQLVLKKDLVILDTGVFADRGTALLTLTEGDLLDLRVTSYKYNVTQLDSDGTYLPGYVNSYYGQVGIMQVANDAYPVLQPSQEAVSFLSNYNDAIRLYEFKSGNLLAHPELKGNTALHTMAFYMTNFIGTVTVQATLDNTPSSFGNYSTIETRTYDYFSGVDYVNFNGIFSYVRVVFVPKLNPVDSSNVNTAYSGTFDKVLYRC